MQNGSLHSANIFQKSVVSLKAHYHSNEQVMITDVTVNLLHTTSIICSVNPKYFIKLVVGLKLGQLCRPSQRRVQLSLKIKCSKLNTLFLI